MIFEHSQTPQKSNLLLCLPVLNLKVEIHCPVMVEVEGLKYDSMLDCLTSYFSLIQLFVVPQNILQTLPNSMSIFKIKIMFLRSLQHF